MSRKDEGGRTCGPNPQRISCAVSIPCIERITLARMLLEEGTLETVTAGSTNRQGSTVRFFGTQP